MKEKRLMDIVLEPCERSFVINNKLIIVEKTLKKGCICGNHWHDYFEIEMILSGEMEHIYDSEKSILSRGCAYLMSYCDFHALKCISDVKMINIRFFENFLDREIDDNLLMGIGRFNIKFSENEFSSIIKNIDQIFIEDKKNLLFDEIMIKNIFSQIIVEIIRKSKKSSMNAAPSAVQKAVSYIRKNFRYDLSVEKAAQYLGMAPNYFGTLFKKNIGVSFNDYVNMLRLKYACNLLENSDYSVKEIAFFSGFNSIEYFFYVFKKNLLTTPNVYRSTHSENVKR